ncbi:hypothetical protein CEP54_011516 [Fusarium duplospermum]|uniref:Uncharacterized protein n=1 Tax=Fusarium duplospermum TaxID=1325734 RepID=A0A428PDR2_9HYPO|nr:hypothetical protein CEP54_011516 [Fusarium duplospermum]
MAMASGIDEACALDVATGFRKGNWDLDLEEGRWPWSFANVQLSFVQSLRGAAESASKDQSQIPSPSGQASIIGLGIYKPGQAEVDCSSDGATLRSLPLVVTGQK